MTSPNGCTSWRDIYVVNRISMWNDCHQASTPSHSELYMGTSAARRIENRRFSLAVEEIAVRAERSQVRMFAGTQAVLSQLTLLQELAASYGQAQEFDQLPHTLLEGEERGKRPYLLLFPSCEGSAGSAALFQTYKIAGVSTRCFMPIDFGGAMNVIAPQERRKAVAIQSARHLFRRGALMVLSSVVGEDFANEAVEIAKKTLCAEQVRPIQEKLLLKETFDDTLATMGANTRRNFRRYSRRAARGAWCQLYGERAGFGGRGFWS